MHLAVQKTVTCWTLQYRIPNSAQSPRLICPTNRSTNNIQILAKKDEILYNLENN